MPGGAPIGVKARGPRPSAKRREIRGDEQDAEHLFAELTKGGAVISKPGYQGTLMRLPQGRGTVGYRPKSKSGPPTIDVNVIDSRGQRIPIEKIKFVG
jgi:hypothetical protein